MVVLTHNSRVSSHPHNNSHYKQNSFSKGHDENYNRRLFNLVAFLVLGAVLMKFIVEFRIQENLRLKARPPVYKTYILQEQHEVVEIILNGTNKHVDSIFQVELIDTPPYSSLLNISDFKWLRNNISLCSANVSPFTKLLPILIHTSRKHFMERKAIRDSWASIKNYRNWSVRPVFLLGESGREEQAENELLEEAELDREHHLYGDIITGTFIDSYRNLTYKHLMGYKWILEHCSNASFVLKTNDDLFVDVLHFIDKIMDESENKIFPQTGTDIYCHEFVGSGPSRSKEDKWFVSEEEWPEPTYPFYCSGWGYGISVNWIDKIYLMSSQTRYFWVDDVFIGILMNMAKSFFSEGPKVEKINDLYTFDNRLYVDMCKNGSQDNTFLANAKRKFGSVVYVARNDEFGMEMGCLWRKTLMDRNML